MILRFLPKNLKPQGTFLPFKNLSRAFWPFGSKKKEKDEAKVEEEEKEIKDYGNLGFLVKEVK
jgi:hypothetical protein